MWGTCLKITVTILSFKISFLVVSYRDARTHLKSVLADDKQSDRMKERRTTTSRPRAK